MATEIERKFLVKGDFRPFVSGFYLIKQGYICRSKSKSVRIRIRNDQAFLTIKGASSDNGLSRYEFEQPVTVAEANELFKLCEPGMIEKERFIVPYQGHNWEVDLFLGENKGLIIAEIELSAADETFYTPEWVGEEVTGQQKYYNSMLTLHPYNQWDISK